MIIGEIKALFFESESNYRVWVKISSCSVFLSKAQKPQDVSILTDT